ncbi:hypothetical protein [Actinocrinis sp.]|uniref:SCO2583/SCO2584 N-terminal domain-containing protein n=1 Tax=Actinocrinis sp. TaxID=1920516 RepID=UPI002C20232E|nr:hypothetical protein [Actinocrinis sp.]HXR73301.1 hypothetical protein [Actinocrinis sp.]
MTERFPEQRNSSAQRRADANQVPARASDGAASLDDAPLVFDESFVAAAPVHEPSAQARAVLARRRAELFADPSATRRSLDQPERRWAVRPAHHLSAVRLPAVAVTTCVLATVAVLLILLR